MVNERKNGIRQRIIDTASHLFYTQGYNNTGINQIIEESGVAKSSLYSTFRSKEEILMEYLISAGAATDEAMVNATSGFSDPKSKILAIFDFLTNLVQQDGYNGCNFLNIISEIPRDSEAVVGQIRAQKNSVRKLFMELLEPIGKEGHADEIYIAFEGALIGNKVHHAIWPITNARRIAERLLQ